ncbi:hypothetical protein AOQ84DRAFT_365094 [Glonium stellatum]|uniref:Uncharacterized protein n=1 Tax=Glonium stellatum TaxID=574774 RepID=A0A8E2JRW4_9PEZI|nr:hypothetical protein AOQ84DRAFT_365094 [Glonium stellatum]
MHKVVTFRQVLRKLAKKHGLSDKKREKPAIDAEDLALVLETNLVTIKKKYIVGRHQIQVHFLLLLGFCTASRPKALLDLCYQHIMITLLRDLEGGPYKIVPEFTFEFTKKYLGMKEVNTFLISEIIFNPSLILSPHVFLLGLLFSDQAFAAPNLTSAEQLSKLYIEPGRNELRLPLRSDLNNTPIFRRSIKVFHSYKVSPD